MNTTIIITDRSMSTITTGMSTITTGMSTITTANAAMTTLKMKMCLCTHMMTKPSLE